jgi:hypothetical protein
MTNTKKNQKRLAKLYRAISDALYKDAELDIAPKHFRMAMHCFCYGIVKFLSSRSKEEIDKYRICLKFKSPTSTNPYIYITYRYLEGKCRILVYRDDQYVKYASPDKASIPDLVFNYNTELESYIQEMTRKYHFTIFRDINDLMGCIFDLIISYSEDKALTKTSWKVNEEGIYKIKTRQSIDSCSETHYECFFTINPDISAEII